MKRLKYGVATLWYDEYGKWRLAFAVDDGYRKSREDSFRDESAGYQQIIATIQKEFARHKLTSSRVFLLHSPPGSDNIFPSLNKVFQPVVVVHRERLMLHKARIGDDFQNLAEMLAEAAISGMKTDLLLLETTNACTFRCLFCPQDQMTRKKERMPFELAEAVVREYAANSIGGIAFHVMGEPTSNPYLPKLVKLVADLKIDHTLTTNASTLTKNMAVDLFKNGLNRVQISVQSFGKEQFYSFKRPAPKYSYESVLKNIKQFIQVKWEYAPNAEIEIHMLDTSLYQPRGVKVVCSDDEARDVLNFWQKFMLQAARETGDSKIISRINMGAEVKLERDNLADVNFFLEPAVSLKFKMAGHWTQEFLEEDEVIISAAKGTCHLFTGGGQNNQLAVLSNGNVALCCFDYDGGTVVGSIKQHSLREIEERAFEYRKKLIHSNDIPFEICRRCLGIRVNVLAMGKTHCSSRGEVSFNDVALVWAGEETAGELERLRQIGISQLSLVAEENLKILDNAHQHYRVRDIPHNVEAIIFPSGWVGDEIVRELIDRYPDKFVGQINLVALNPFAREKIIAYRQKMIEPTASRESLWVAGRKFLKKMVGHSKYSSK